VAGPRSPVHQGESPASAKTPCGLPGATIPSIISMAARSGGRSTLRMLGHDSWGLRPACGNDLAAVESSHISICARYCL